MAGMWRTGATWWTSTTAASAALWDYQIDTLKMWAEHRGRLPLRRGADGAAGLLAARAATRWRGVRPGCIWLAESVEPLFIAYNRANGTACLSDAELYRAFDLCYDYDTANAFHGRAARQRRSSRPTPRRVNAQEGIFPANYVKLRFLENHDRPRAGFLIPGRHARWRAGRPSSTSSGARRWSTPGRSARRSTCRACSSGTPSTWSTGPTSRR